MAWWTFVLMAVAGFACAYALLATVVTLVQRRLIYKPDPRRSTPQDEGFDGIDVWTVTTPDGAQLVAWYAKAKPGQPTLLYFHGNAGHIELRSSRLAELASRGFGVLMPSYRGYGGSTGQPSERALIADAQLMFATLRESGVAATNIIVFGESLGTGVATQLAALKPTRGLVLDSPYTSMVDLGTRDYPWLPVRRLLWDHYDTHRHMRQVSVPVLVLHGEADGLVPCDMGRAVARAAVAPCTILTYPGATHLAHCELGSFDDVTAWIKMVTRSHHDLLVTGDIKTGLTVLQP
jgi:fermentation-respiration switch protein FrsA (DUF1100 family)